MKIIILKEKYGDRYLEWSDDKNIKEAIASKILNDRISQGWFTDEEQKEISEAMLKNKCLSLLSERSEYEYEGFEVGWVEMRTTDN